MTLATAQLYDIAIQIVIQRKFQLATTFELQHLW